MMLTRSLGVLCAFALAACAAFSSGPASADDNDGFSHDDGGGSHGQPVKVMIVSMFGPEGQVWLDRLGPWRDIAVDGLSPDYPAVHCNKQDICVMTTGMGHSNAAASNT